MDIMSPGLEEPFREIIKIIDQSDNPIIYWMNKRKQLPKHPWKKELFP